MMKLQTVLVIGYVWPEPNSSAAGSHMLSLLKLFREQNWRVVFATPAQETDHMVDLGEFDIESQAIQLNDSSFDEFAAELNPDMVVFDRFMMEEQFGWRVAEVCPDALRILDTEDLQSLRGARQKALKENRELTADDRFSDLAKREMAAIYRCDLSLIISDFELRLLLEQFQLPEYLLYHLPFMLDLNNTYPNQPFEQRQHFVTIGNFRHAPNWDSVLYLQQVWPLIRQQLPHAELHIYGSYPPKKATQLDNPKSGFRVKGWAADAYQVLAHARVCLAPLRFGAGIKGKLMDAMLTGTPSVTTSIGAEGIALAEQWPGVVAESSAEAIASAAVELYQSSDKWQSAANKTGKILEDKFDGEQLGKALIEKLESLYQDLTSHRRKNFTGAMLQHHQMQGTRFMSKWIETKTQLQQPKDSS